MTRGKRRAIAAAAAQHRDLSRSDLERAFIFKRSATAPEVIAALVEPDVDVREIARVARGVLAGERRAVLRFREFANERVNSLARVLCLSGDDRSLAQGLDLLRAQARLMPQRKLPMAQKQLLADALILQGMYGEASGWLSVAGFEGPQYTRYALSIFNPFRQDNRHAMPVDEWVGRFNELMSPSSELTAVELVDDHSILPFERLSAPSDRRTEGPLVTIVMSSFRPDESIFGAVRSIINQTWKSLELLVVDDASGAEFDHIYERVDRMDARIRVVRQRVNGGTYLIRNKALSLARGGFIGFQDNDDWSHPERIERQMQPMLTDPSIVATQSLCFRTDEYLDPVRIGYRKHLRRNESSLLLRAEVVRRVGFFHQTRKGGDTEYRLRIEAAFGRPVTLVGDEALAIIRLTPGSLSRDEFSAGFRHSSRLVYTACYTSLHARAEQEDSYYQSLYSRYDTFVPAKFQPRQRAPEAEYFDVVIVADLRGCTLSDDWIISTCVALRRLGLRVGLAHYVGLRTGARASDTLSPDITELFIEGAAEPVDLGERRIVGLVVIAEGSLLQHFPWRTEPWLAQRVVARREGPGVDGELYDDSTVGFSSLRLFGVRPTWISRWSDANTVHSLVLDVEKSVSPSTSTSQLDTYASCSPSDLVPLPRLGHCSVTVPSI